MIKNMGRVRGCIRFPKPSAISYMQQQTRPVKMDSLSHMILPATLWRAIFCIQPITVHSNRFWARGLWNPLAVSKQEIMFCRNCRHTADDLGSAHELQKRFDSGQSRMRLLQNSIGRSLSKTGLISITLQILQHSTKDWMLAVLSNSLLTWKAREPLRFMHAQSLQHFGLLSTKHEARSTNHNFAKNKACKYP